MDQESIASIFVMAATWAPGLPFRSAISVRSAYWATAQASASWPLLAEVDSQYWFWPQPPTFKGTKGCCPRLPSSQTSVP